MSDDHQQRDFFAITEHRLYVAGFDPDRHLTDTMKFFRVPRTANGFGTLPEVTIADIREGDVLLLLDISDRHLCLMRMVYVRKREGECYDFLTNDFLSWGQDLIDRFAGLLGRVPTE